MTGRKGRVVTKVDGSVGYESRSKEDVALEVLNITEKQRFMNGDKVLELYEIDNQALSSNQPVIHSTLSLDFTSELKYNSEPVKCSASTKFKLC